LTADVFLVSPRATIVNAWSDNDRSSAFASAHGARIHRPPTVFAVAT